MVDDLRCVPELLRGDRDIALLEIRDRFLVCVNEVLRLRREAVLRNEQAATEIARLKVALELSERQRAEQERQKAIQDKALRDAGQAYDKLYRAFMRHERRMTMV